MCIHPWLFAYTKKQIRFREYKIEHDKIPLLSNFELAFYNIDDILHYIDFVRIQI